MGPTKEKGNAIIMAGATISDRMVIYSSALPTNDLPRSVILVGSPTRVSGQKTINEVITQLRSLRCRETSEGFSAINAWLFHTSNMNTAVTKLDELRANYLTSKKVGDDKT